jgi:S-adenosylmethionine hydrolase
LAYVGSAGLLEIAIHKGNAQEQLGLKQGDQVELLGVLGQPQVRL